MNSADVGIIDYGMGNLKSVFNAFAAIGASPRMLQRPEEIHEVPRVVLPGVGAFGDGMRNLRAGGWIPVLEKEVRDGGKHFLGICLGMQLLATRGTEHGLNDGLDWIGGDVLRLEDRGGALRVPHIGWDDVHPVSDRGSFRGDVGKGGVFYFVHSFHFQPTDPGVVDGWCDYGVKFAASLAVGNIWAVQFHPEKSQKQGLQILKNFVAM